MIKRLQEKLLWRNFEIYLKYIHNFRRNWMAVNYIWWWIQLFLLRTILQQNNSIQTEKTNKKSLRIPIRPNINCIIRHLSLSQWNTPHFLLSNPSGSLQRIIFDLDINFTIVLWFGFPGFPKAGIRVKPEIRESNRKRKRIWDLSRGASSMATFITLRKIAGGRARRGKIKL